MARFSSIRMSIRSSWRKLRFEEAKALSQKRTSGIRLLEKTDPRKNTYWVNQLMISLSGCTALELTVVGLAGFHFGSTLLIILLTGAVLCGVFALLVKMGQWRWFVPGLLVVMFLLSLVFRQQVLEGWRLYWNQLSSAMTMGKGWILPQLQNQMASSKRIFAISLFGVLLAGVLSIISCSLAAAAPMVLVVLPPMVLFTGMVFLGIGTDFSMIVLVLISSVLILLCCGKERQRLTMTMVISWLICLTVAFFAVKTLKDPGIVEWAGTVSSNVQHRIHEIKYETEYNTLPEGDFNRHRSISKKAKPAMQVTMEVPEPLYLRGFTGAVFSENVWQTLDSENLVKNRDLLYWLNLNAFTPDSQFAAAADSLELTKNQIQIENTGACSQYLYVPFSLCDGTYLYKENLNTGGAFGDGVRSYSYQALTGGADAVTQTLEFLKNAEDTQVLQYRKAESAYRQIVLDQYLQIPDEAKELLGKYWDELASKYDGIHNLTIQQGQECALRFLGTCFPETGIPQGMELPLDHLRGTSYQYATVAVLTMRYFGIPARYAEGYVITEQMAQKAEPGTAITVDSNCACAWAEIYQDGIGWIPVDLTPGLGDVIEEQPDNTLEGDLETDKEEDEKESEEDADTASQPEPLGGTVVKILKKSLKWLVYLLLIILLLIVFLWVRRKKHLQRKEQHFRAEVVADAVGWIVADTVLLLQQMGFDRGNGSLRELSQPVEQRFGENYARKLEKIILLNDHAVFSKRSMEESCREAVLAFRKETLERLKTETKWYKRWWLQWVKCLY